jgi:AcrR family transcriptional regulator
MEEIAAALGVAKGTLYGYVESKAALLGAALRHADGRDPLPDESNLPLPTPQPGATAARARAILQAEAEGLELTAALRRKRVGNVAAEFTAIVHDLYDRMLRNRRAIKLLDRCAGELPEFGAVWFGEGRWAQHAALAQYLDQRTAQGLLRPVLSIPVAARMILETIAFWAVHLHWDPSPQRVSEVEVRATISEMIHRSLARE